MEQYFNNIEVWKELLACDFNRGYLTGVLLVLAVVIVLIVLRLLFSFLFRTRRARSITVPSPDGDVQIAQDAVESVISVMLEEFPEVLLDSMKLYRRGQKYSLLLNCRFAPGKRTFPDIVGSLKETIFAGLEKQFGITGLRRIRIALTALEGTPELSGTKPDAGIPPVLPENNGL